MVVTRNKALYDSFNPLGWNADYDMYIDQQLFQFCTPFVSLVDPKDFNFVLSQVAFMCLRKFYYRVSAKNIKKMVNELRNRFFAFRRFIRRPGVTFNEYTYKFVIDGQYREVLQRDNVRAGICS